MKKIISIFLVIFLVFFYNTGYFIEIKDEIQEKFLKNDLDTRVETIDNKETNIKEVYNFKQIKIGDSKDSVIKKINKPNRIDKSEYNFNWYVYNAYKENFVMVGIKNNK
ncbi:CAP-associated domain-containing protein, partial [Terrisporobacter petrolearius]